MKKGARKMKAKRPNPVASFDWTPMHITIHPHGDMPFMFHIPRGSWNLIKGDAKAFGLGMAQFMAREFSMSARSAYESLHEDERPDELYYALQKIEDGEFGVVRLVLESAGSEVPTP